MSVQLQNLHNMTSFNIYHMNTQDISLKRKNTLILFGKPQRYDQFKRASNLAKQIYSDDLTFYHDSAEERHSRNLQEIRKLKSLLEKKVISPEMLQFNVSNCFYPSYVLHHHFMYFSTLVNKLSNDHPQSKQLNYLASASAQGQIVGALFKETIHTQLKKAKNPTIKGNIIQMKENSYFYSNSTSLHIHVCCFPLKTQTEEGLVFIQLRDKNGDLCPGVEVRDMGANISLDYLSVGYRFNDVKPLVVISKKNKIFRQLKSQQKIHEFALSLQDLSRGLHLAVKYGQMRKQFATKQKDKSERNIIEYQAVHSRIIDGFSILYAFSSMYQRFLNIPRIGQFLAPFLSVVHKTIFQRLIHLRQCCGGFGFMQISGFPAQMERVAKRAAQPHLTQIPQIPEIMKRFHYYSSSDEIMDIAMKNIVRERIEEFQPLFYVFLSICINMRKQKQDFHPTKYLQQMLLQSCMQSMHSSVSLIPPEKKNPSEELLYYLVVNYVLEYSRYINWDLVQGIDREEFLRKIMHKKSELLQIIFEKLPKLNDILEIGYVRNVLVGQDNSEQFYEKLFSASENNRRNSQQYRRQIQKPLVELMKAQRAKL